MPDMRVALFAATAALYGRTWVWFTIGQRSLRMPMLLAALLTSFFLWLAENIGTSTGTWLYGGQTTRQMVGLAKMGSWYLLLYVSFATVTLVLREPFKEIRASKAPARKVRHKAPG